MKESKSYILFGKKKVSRVLSENLCTHENYIKVKPKIEKLVCFKRSQILI